MDRVRYISTSKSAAFLRSVLKPTAKLSSREVATLTAGEQYRADIDGLRAVAVGAVIAYHAFPSAVPGGFVGVDVFFVISGFLISGIIFRDLASGSFSFAEFYRRRIRRIIPALLIVLIATWSIAWFVLMADEYAVLGWHLSAASVFLSNFVLGHEAGYFDRAIEYKPLLHLWSLAVEEQFYLIWPISMYAIWRLRLKPIPILATLVLLSFGLNVAIVAAQPAWDFYSLPTRLWELALGALPAVLVASTVCGTIFRNAMSVTGFGLVLGATFMLKGQDGYPGWAALAPTIGTMLLIIAGPDSWINRSVLSLRPVVLIGLISYPLYLWHWPLLSFARVALFGEPGTWVKGGIVTLAVLLAWVTYGFVEKPIRFGFKRRQNWRRFAPAALIVLLCSVGVLGLITRDRAGFPGRFPEAVRYLASPTYDDSIYRKPTCLLEMNKDAREFSPDCAPKGNGPVVFLWGDSHAAHLYAGLVHFQDKAGFSIAQYTAGACPPILGVDPTKYHVQVPFCRSINDYTIRLIEQMKPKVLIMAAMWYLVSVSDLDNLKPTIARLKKVGIEHIILVGPVPVWDPSLPKRLLRFYLTSIPRHVPNRMSGASLAYPREFDNKLQKIAESEGVEFISAIDVFCHDNECMTNVGPGPANIVTNDSTHLTTAASSFFVSKLLPMIDADLGSRRK